jgi:predicted ATPase/class 3 adenylate cyclase
LNQPTVATTTFLFSDIEGSTRLVMQLGDVYAQLLEEHRSLIRSAVEAAGGRIFGSEGDALFAAFPSASPALQAAAEAQRALENHPWPENGRIRVRMGVHTGEAMLAGGDYVGLALHQAARITSAAHGGMVLVSQATRQLASPLPEELELRDMGERRLKDLAAPERLYQLLADGLADDFPPLRTLDARPNNLPLQLTSFVGRDEVLAARRALDGTRLLTLTGPGGTGKTRLSLQLAADASDDFPDGVWFVALDATREPELVSSVIVATVGVPEAQEPPYERLVQHLRDRRVLLVLDNLEQIVEAGATVANLLRELPDLKVIVTSRVVLHVYGEQEFPVPPLGLPAGADGRVTMEDAARSEAVRLFVERAMAVQPSFRLTDDNAPTLVDICRRLDGLPLAIELAAARTRILTAQQLAARLDQRLGVLTGGARDLPARQQTLRGAIDWSHDLLDEPDKLLFRRFAVFAGGSFLNEADVVCGPASELEQDILDGLSSLVDKSLLRSALAADEDPRFAMLATIREYAFERLASSDEAEEIARRHAHAYLDVAEAHAHQLLGPEARRWLDRLQVDHDNLRLALDWAEAHGEAGVALRLIAAVWRFWHIRGHLYEARERVDRVAALSGVAHEPALVRARGFEAAGGICYWQGDSPAAHRYYGLALEAARSSGDLRSLARALYNYGFSPVADDSISVVDRARAGRPFWEESRDVYRELEDDEGVADASWALAMAQVAEGDNEGGRRSALESLELYRRAGNRFGMGWAHFMLAGYELAEGDYDRARPHLRHALSLFGDAADLSGIMLALVFSALIAANEGDQQRGHRLGGAAQALRSSTGTGTYDDTLEFFEFKLPTKPEDPELLRHWEHGAEMTVDEAVAYALEGMPDS